MRKSTLIFHPIKHSELVTYTLALSAFCLLVSWGVELLARELFRIV